ncbi:DUF4349 domain-containing protein [Microbacterium sp. NPDC091313]
MTTSPLLPEIDDERVARIERQVFRRIGDDRRRSHRRRVRVWSATAAAAAVVVVAAVIAPQITASLRPSAGSGSALAPASGTEAAPYVDDGSGMSGSSSSGGAADSAAGGVAAGSREMLTSGSATVVVPDAAAAATRIADAAVARGGYVESQSIGSSAGTASGGSDMTTLPYPMPGGDAITVRVPADELSALIDELGSVGEVTSSSVSRQDVTDQAIDLRARIAASEASVQRLTELMSQAADVSDLIAAETALSERQAALESDRQQLAALEGQVEMSTLTVSLVPETEPVTADPAGFGDGLAAGWNGLVATLNGIVVALGFLLPWLVVAGLAAAVVWGVVRLARRVRRRRSAAPTE